MCAALLAGCASEAPLDKAPPQRFDLSGTWLLQADLSDAAPDARRLQSPPPPLPGSNRSRRPRAGGLAFVAHDFPVLVAQRMTIEQNNDSMGIEYDKGGYRDLSWGERSRGLWTVNTGWNEEGELVVRSKASDARALEVLSLSADEQQLTVLVQIKAGEQDLDVRRVYTRTP